MREWSIVLLVCVANVVPLCLTLGSHPLGTGGSNNTSWLNFNNKTEPPLALSPPQSSRSKRETFRIDPERKNLLPVAFRTDPERKKIGNDFRIDPARKKLLGDALSWLTLRDKGNILSQSDRTPIQEILTNRYKSSKFYRSYVIAFQHGVLPKLTLNENDNCDSSFMKKYRDSDRNSFSYYFQKKFIFDSYYDQQKKPNKFPNAYCDYRQGLVCHPVKSKCLCPEGGKMESLQNSSPPKKRCAIEKGNECSLADLTHDKDGYYTNFKNNVHRQVFNLEKPNSCMTGTVCRIGANGSGIFKCHEAGNKQWASPQLSLSYMDECTLDVYANPGMCAPIKVASNYQLETVCYDYGPRAIPGVKGVKVASRTGFCCRPFGAVLPKLVGAEVIEDDITTKAEPLLLAYVNPRTIEMRGDKFRSYQDAVSQMTHKRFLDDQNNLPVEKDAPCSVSRTKELEELFKFYASLENDPLPGEDFVATEALLIVQLAELRKVLGGSRNGRICKFWWSFVAMSGPPYACVVTGSPEDANGNDGTCQLSTSNVTRAHADLVKARLTHVGDSYNDTKYEESNVDLAILRDHPEPPLCSLEKSYPPEGPSPTASQEHKHFDLRPGTNICPQGSVCYEDLHDSHGIYKDPTKKDCDLIDGYEPDRVCHSNSLGLELGECEKEELEDRMDEARKDLGIYSKLELGAPCDYNAERIVRAALHPLFNPERMSLYVYLSMLEKGRTATGGFCDSTKLLTCSKGNRCECLQGAGVRATGDWETKSDYCYMTSGPCSEDLSQILPLTVEEERDVGSHYAHSSPCEDNNVCVLVDQQENQTCIGGPWNVVVITTTPEVEVRKVSGGERRRWKDANQITIILTPILILLVGVLRVN